MPVAIPSLPPRLVDLVVCAHVLDKKKTPTVKRIGTKVAYFRGKTGKTHVRLVGGDEPGTHLHLEVSLASERKPVANTCTKKEIESSLMGLMGEDVDLKVKAGFRIALNDLPLTGIVRATYKPQITDEMFLLMTGGCVEVTGYPVWRFFWSIDPEDETAYITIEAFREKAIANNYVTEEIRLMVNAFKTLILGEAADVSLTNTKDAGKE